MKQRDEIVFETASMYYVQGMNMESIAKHFSVSRSSVSRMLSHARESGIIRISLEPSQKTQSQNAKRIERIFGINNVTTVPTPKHVPNSPQFVLEHVAKHAAVTLSSLIKEDDILSLAWGNTVAEVVRYLPHHPLPGVTLVQLNGAASPQDSGIPYVGRILSIAAEAIGAKVVQFPVPAFFDHAATKDLMWKEGSVRYVLNLQRHSNIAVFGVGGLSANMPSHVYSAGYLSNKELSWLVKNGVVGDVCTVLLRKDGSFRDIELNSRATGPNPAQLQSIPRRFCIVAGQQKTIPLLAALRARVMTDLIVDEATASRVLDLCSAYGIVGVE